MSKPRFPLVLVAAAVGALLIPGTAPAPPRAAESVTLTVLRTYDNLIRTFKYRFSGTGRKRVAYAEAFESGKARIFTAPSCSPD